MVSLVLQCLKMWGREHMKYCVGKIQQCQASYIKGSMTIPNSLKTFRLSQKEVNKVDQLDIRAHWQKGRRLQMFTDTKASVHQAMAE